MEKYYVGECWSLKDRSDSFVLITRIEFDREERVIHFSYFEDNGNKEIFHIPITDDAFSLSVEKKTGLMKVKDKHIRAIKDWESDSGGVWNIDINEIVRITFETIEEQ